jgi:NitT/TauT family transport system substrate-binding protein
MFASARARRAGGRRLWGLYVLVALLVLPAAGPASAGTDDARQLRKVTIAMIAVDPTAQVMYAKHRGFFRQQGIDAEIKVVAATQGGPALLSGEAQFAAMPAGTLAQLKSRGAPFRPVAGAALYRPKTATTVLVAAPSARITRARDLVGKRVGLDSPFSIAHVGLLRWLERRGVSEDDIELSTFEFAQVYALLMRNEIDAAVLPEPLATLAVQGGARLIALPFDSVCPVDCLLILFIARSDVDRDLAARFRNAVQDAAAWANQERNHAASGAILARYQPIQPALIAKMARTTYATRLRVRKAQPWLDVFKEYGLVPESFTAQDLLK